jgi:hypothetical protein
MPGGTMPCFQIMPELISHTHTVLARRRGGPSSAFPKDRIAPSVVE